MCFHAKQSKTAAQLKNRFKVRFDKEIEYEPSEAIEWVHLSQTSGYYQ
jgi:hypothetical protein